MAQAQTWPAKPLRFIVPFPPGGTTDIQARMINERMAARLGQPVVLDYRAGANAAIGMEITARAPADGYTFIISTVGSWAVAPHLSKLSYDVQNDFAPLIHLATTPGVLLVHPSVPAKNVKELIALARQRPNELTYGSSGIGGFGPGLLPAGQGDLDGIVFARDPGAFAGTGQLADQEAAK
jgi:tripartite-type tricarboxylate transporter receptor subunit TctC